jgi:hypothetical protein
MSLMQNAARYAPRNAAKVRSIVFKQIFGVRDEATEMDRWCPN